ncbi:MAG TPA: N-6 DNA methylase [Bacteroidales bacterium]|nr:N-6 DNA methylase [Bacteroidales bacterium]
MSFFQNAVINRYLKTLNAGLVQSAYKKFTAYFHNPEIQNNIRNAKEEQFQEGFLRELFVNIFGYTINPEPNFNLTTEFKNLTGSKKADGAILSLGKAIAVIELKGTDTRHLDNINQQAFNYKNNQTDCIYVITSNFEKIRFYIHNSVDQLEFNLFTLTENEFQLLWLCLAADCLLMGIPASIKEESLLEEENITKYLYKDYANFRTDLWQNMVLKNPHADQLTLFKKTQKLLDRFLFIYFAEDSGLLPPNSIIRMVERWQVLKEEDAYKPLYDIFRQFFGYINTGRKGKTDNDDIFAFNGGLFLPDEILDTISIDDEVLQKHTKKLSTYDFQSEVDVNILGHIFENSLNEVENVKAQIEGHEADRSKSKRKKDGIFYTPRYITKYIVENTLGKLCKEKKAELGIIDEEYAKDRRKRKKATLHELDDRLKAYREWLLNITICDPACGSGAFLNQALEFLIEEHQYIDELQAQLLGSSFVFPDVENHILERNIFGVDINEESVEIARLSLWLRTAQRGRKLTSLNNNIKCGNSLIDDPSVAGAKAFNWQKEFPDIFKEKKKKAWHITTATHDTRTSQRMIDYKVRQRRANGEMHIDRSICFDDEDSIKIAEIFCDIITEDLLNCLAFNVCYDHVHIVLVCEEEELTNIVRKLKGKSAQKFKEYKSIAKDETFHLWQQKFHKTEITDQQQLYNTIKYIRTNREKHHLPDISKGLQPLADIRAANTEPNDTVESYKGLQPLVILDENKGLQHFIDKMTCTIEHAFRTEYKGGFDVVIGNPPYGAVLNEKEKRFVLANYTCYKGNFDIYSAFIQHAFKLIKKNGYCSYINPVSWQSGENYFFLRDYISNNSTLEIAIKLPYDVFEDAYVDTGVYVLRKRTQPFYSTLVYDFPTRAKYNGDLTTDITFKELPSTYWQNLSSLRIVLSPVFYELLSKVNKDIVPLSSVSSSIRGILPNENDVSNEYIPTYKKYFVGSLNRYIHTDDFIWVNYGEHLKEKPKDFGYFQGDRLLIRRIISRQFRIMADLVNEEFVNKKDYYNLKLTDAGYDIRYVLAIVCSQLVSFLKTRGSTTATKDDFAQLSLSDVRGIPIKPIDLKDQKLFVDKVDIMLLKTKELHAHLLKFIKLLSSKFATLKITNKLQDWPSLDFKAFIKELDKQKIKLPLYEQAEWISYFELEKQKAQTLKSEIEKTDKEIDRMVYELYGLTEDEIRIVEGK